MIITVFKLLKTNLTLHGWASNGQTVNCNILFKTKAWLEYLQIMDNQTKFGFGKLTFVHALTRLQDNLVDVSISFQTYQTAIAQARYYDTCGITLELILHLKIQEFI